MYPRIMERETEIVDSTADTAGTATADENPISTSYLTRSDGVVYANYATLTVAKLSAVIAARKIRCVGIHLQGPEPGTDFTPYAVSVNAHCVDDKLRPVFFIGESPAVINADAAGNNVTDVRRLRYSMAGAVGAGNSLHAELVVVVKPNTADRAVCFGIGMLTGVVLSGDEQTFVHMTVRRLIGVDPLILDTRKL